jgi:hypothetical protein
VCAVFENTPIRSAACCVFISFDEKLSNGFFWHVGMHEEIRLGKGAEASFLWRKFALRLVRVRRRAVGAKGGGELGRWSMWMGKERWDVHRAEGLFGCEDK